MLKYFITNIYSNKWVSMRTLVLLSFIILSFWSLSGKEENLDSHEGLVKTEHVANFEITNTSP